MEGVAASVVVGIVLTDDAVGNTAPVVEDNELGVGDAEDIAESLVVDTAFDVEDVEGVT